MGVLSVVLSEGADLGLWPASRQAFPKPFVQFGGSTLLQQAVARGQASSAGQTLIVTGKDHLFLSRDVLAHMPTPPSATFLLTPAGQGHTLTLALAALQCVQQAGADTVMLIAPADQLIPDTQAFASAMQDAIQRAQAGAFVVFGIAPTQPEAGRCHVEVQRIAREPQPAQGFIAAPDATTAQQYVASGRHYWNSGIYCVTARTLLAALTQHAPQVLKTAQERLAHATDSNGAIDASQGETTTPPAASFDSIVLAQAGNAVLVPAAFGWSDVGSWTHVAQAQATDAQGNSLPAGSVAMDTTGTHVQVHSHTPKVVTTAGIHDLVIVDTPDALLVAHKSSTAHVPAIVQTLQSQRHEAALLPAVVHRPWGTYASLKEEAGYKVKRITVKPGASLSLQYHHQRAEHWVVVRGRGIVQIGDVEHETLPGQYRYIPLQEKHRLTNTGSEELVLIEVQCGSYLGEDDIVRLADTYGRA